MAKYHEVFEDHEELFINFISQIDSLRDLNVKILGCNRLKEICKVSKASDILKHMTNEDVIILLNEAIFEKLEAEQKNMIVEEYVARIYFDPEKDKLTLINPDFSTFSLLLLKYGAEKCLNLKTLIKELFSEEAQEDAENNN
jgi:hypothetical protein